MKSILNTLVALQVLWLSGLTKAAALPKPTCEPGGIPILNRVVAAKKISKIVFFASWCSSCREHLLSSEPSTDLLIATFDEKEEAERALTALKVATPCLLDDGIAKALKILDVPSSLRVVDGKILPQALKK